jgi:CheY-like chemotaxis protein
MPRGGTLHIATANAGLDESFGPEEEVKPGDYVLLRVTDTGTGMSPEVLAKAFEPFFTTKDIGQGTGLGLSQVYGFIKQSGGQVKIESRLGEGTAVSLYLPRLLTGSRAAAADRSGPSLPKSAGHECILVVEDEDGVRELTVEMLHELGYKVLQATDSISAIAALKKEPSVGLLFTDIGLPGKMNGRQLAEAARKIRPGLKVLLTSGYAQDAVTSDPKGLGFELIGKPFSAEVLASRIRQVLDATDTTRVTG